MTSTEFIKHFDAFILSDRNTIQTLRNLKKVLQTGGDNLVIYASELIIEKLDEIFELNQKKFEEKFTKTELKKHGDRNFKQEFSKVFEIIHTIFLRSYVFRLRICENLRFIVVQHFLKKKSTVKKVLIGHEEMESIAKKFLHWHDRFSPVHPELVLSFNYLKHKAPDYFVKEKVKMTVDDVTEKKRKIRLKNQISTAKKLLQIHDEKVVHGADEHVEFYTNVKQTCEKLGIFCLVQSDRKKYVDIFKRQFKRLIILFW